MVELISDTNLDEISNERTIILTIEYKTKYGSYKCTATYYKSKNKFYIYDTNAKITNPDGTIETLNCIKVCKINNITYMIPIIHDIIDPVTYIVDQLGLPQSNPDYTKEQLDAIKLYTYNGDTLLSFYLRNEKKFSFQLLIYYLMYEEKFIEYGILKCELEYIEKFYKTLKSCFITSYKSDIIVYRGITSILDDISFIKYTTPISTSINPLKAYEFASIHDPHEYKQLIKYIIPAGTKVCQILGLSFCNVKEQNNDEDEDDDAIDLNQQMYGDLSDYFNNIIDIDKYFKNNQNEFDEYGSLKSNSKDNSSIKKLDSKIINSKIKSMKLLRQNLFDITKMNKRLSIKNKEEEILLDNDLLFVSTNKNTLQPLIFLTEKEDKPPSDYHTEYKALNDLVLTKIMCYVKTYVALNYI